MYLEQLFYFLEVVKNHSINKTAQNLHISQPALSKSIKNLETELGQPLLKRSSKGVYPTILGQKVYDDFLIIQSMMDTWYTSKRVTNLSGEVHVGCIPVISSHLVHNIAFPFHQVEPNISVVIHDVRVQNVLDLLKSSVINLAIVALPPLDNGNIMTQAKSAGFSIHHLFTDTRKLLIGACHSLADKDFLSLDDLKTLSLAYYSTTSDNDMISVIYKKYFSDSFLLPDRDAIMDLVIKGEAVFIPIYHLIKNNYYMEQGLVKAFDVPIPEINSVAPIISIENSALSPCEKVFLDYLLENFSATLL